ncbi:MAG: hypothetical protein GY772_13245, partial [bacterium]|nr:hypothetical protein [bacterium]
MEKALRHFSFAQHRWESSDAPRRKYCCLAQAIAMLLAHQADDDRLDASLRGRAAAALEAMNGADIVRAGLVADYSAECVDFLRQFDVPDHDPATSVRQKNAFAKRMKLLFCEGRVLAEGTVDTCTSIAVSQIARPLTLYYQSHVKVISMHGATQAAKDALKRLQLITDVMLSRVDAELQDSSLALRFQVFDLLRWHDVRVNPRAHRQLHAHLLAEACRLLRA